MHHFYDWSLVLYTLPYHCLLDIQVDNTTDMDDMITRPYDMNSQGVTTLPNTSYKLCDLRAQLGHPEHPD